MWVGIGLQYVVWMIVVMCVQQVNFVCVFECCFDVFECQCDCGFVCWFYVIWNEIVCEQVVVWFVVECVDVEYGMCDIWLCCIDCMNVVDEVVELFECVVVVEIGCVFVVLFED